MAARGHEKLGQVRAAAAAVAVAEGILNELATLLFVRSERINISLRLTGTRSLLALSLSSLVPSVARAPANRTSGARRTAAHLRASRVAAPPLSWTPLEGRRVEARAANLYQCAVEFVQLGARLRCVARRSQVQEAYRFHLLIGIARATQARSSLNGGGAAAEAPIGRSRAKGLRSVALRPVPSCERARVPPVARTSAGSVQMVA